MANPFSSPQHSPVAPGRCRCGEQFPDALALDRHILGDELAGEVHRDRMAAMQAIHNRSAGMCDYGCHGGNNDFDCPTHGGMREVS